MLARWGWVMVLAGVLVGVGGAQAEITFQNPEQAGKSGSGRTRVQFQLQKVKQEAVSILIRDAAGKTVAKLTRPRGAKAEVLSWDCTLAPSGPYTATVFRKGKPDKVINIEVTH